MLTNEGQLPDVHCCAGLVCACCSHPCKVHFWCGAAVCAWSLQCMLAPEAWLEHVLQLSQQQSAAVTAAMWDAHTGVAFCEPAV